MQFDLFLSICQTEVEGYLPAQEVLFHQFFDQLQLADELGFQTAWIAEAHLSCQTQKLGKNPVIPHFKGEIGLNTDILQLAHKAFAQTKKINLGSAIRNILCNGGPIAHAEALSTFLNLHGLDSSEKRKLYLGFAAGRFPFANEPYGIKPRNQLEEAAWPALKGAVFQQATEVFLRLLQGEELASADLKPMQLREDDFRTKEDWLSVCEVAGSTKEKHLSFPSFWDFEKLSIVPKPTRMELLQLVLGSHDPKTQAFANQFFPTWIFNLSITPGSTIESTHQHMQESFHSAGGAWQRQYMPRTALIFVHEDPSLSAEQQTAKAKEAAHLAMKNYWQAMQGTLDPTKIESAVENSIYGNPKKVAQDLVEKYHPEDRLMTWFDFNNHDNAAIKANMTTFIRQVVPEVKALIK